MYQQIKQEGWPIWGIVVFALPTIFIASGCPTSSSSVGEPTGGLYIVMVPPAVDLNLRGGKTEVTKRVKIAAECFGPNLPEDCDERNPNWSFSERDTAIFGADYYIVDRSAPRTELVITTNSFLIPSLEKMAVAQGVSGGAWAVLKIEVFPGNVPPGLKRSGNQVINLRILFDVEGDQGERSELEAEEEGVPAELAVEPLSHFFPMGGNVPAYKEFELWNPGSMWQPDLTVRSISFTGIGGDSVFFLGSGPDFPIVLRPYDGPTSISVHVDALPDLAPYAATMTIDYDTGSKRISLGAQREY